MVDPHSGWMCLESWLLIRFLVVRRVPFVFHRFSADVRLAAGSLESAVLVLKPRLLAEYTSGDAAVAATLAECPPVTLDSGWTACSGFWIVTSEFTGGDLISKLQVELGATAFLDFDLDNISVVIDGGDPNILILDQSVENKWMPGSEVLVTSHTPDWDGHQVRVIQDVLPHTADPSFVQLKLDSPIPRPTTVLEDARFAVEVALLSRNIVFEGEASETRPLVGGHLWFLHTPLVNQYIEGIDIRNFGQQGILGRYPIHFHFCGDSSAALVSKNTIRHSNQRAIVIHGTHNVKVHENVVFDTKGHAIMLEDGFETGNEFVRNLGASTGAVQQVIPNNGFNGDETDLAPATFWISNPSNRWIGNVAAGSESSGFWFELRLRGTMASMLEDDVNPRSMPLGIFEDNVAHSNRDVRSSSLVRAGNQSAWISLTSWLLLVLSPSARSTNVSSRIHSRWHGKFCGVQFLSEQSQRFVLSSNRKYCNYQQHVCRQWCRPGFGHGRRNYLVQCDDSRNNKWI